MRCVVERTIDTLFVSTIPVVFHVYTIKTDISPFSVVEAVLKLALTRPPHADLYIALRITYHYGDSKDQQTRHSHRDRCELVVTRSKEIETGY
jgi:hypothetical protein